MFVLHSRRKINEAGALTHDRDSNRGRDPLRGAGQNKLSTGMILIDGA